MLTFDLLVSARNLIADPKHHNTGCFHEQVTSFPWIAASYDKFCAVGAILQAAGFDALDRTGLTVLHIHGHPVSEAAKALARAANLTDRDTSEVFKWNDHTTHRDIIHAFDIAILNEHARLQEFRDSTAAQTANAR